MDLFHMYIQGKVDKKDIQKTALGWSDELWRITGFGQAQKNYNKETSASENKTAITAASMLRPLNPRP